MPSKPAGADALPGPPTDHAVPDCVDHAGDLVPRDAREREAGTLPFDGETVAVAYTTSLDADTDLAPRRLGHFALDKLKRAASPRNLHCPNLCHRRLLVGRTNATPRCWLAECREVPGKSIDPHCLVRNSAVRSAIVNHGHSGKRKSSTPIGADQRPKRGIEERGSRRQG
jgi:hypothetical protein